MFAWSGRDLYRPGETVRVNAILRDNDGKTIKPQPVFLRLIKSAETTGTFKYRKADLVADGFDPEKTGTALYVRGGKAGYQKLTAAARTAILNGEGRI